MDLNYAYADNPRKARSMLSRNLMGFKIGLAQGVDWEGAVKVSFSQSTSMNGNQVT